MPETIRVRDIRSLPFYWIQRTLLDDIKPSWKGIITYNALAYYSTEGTCRDVSVRILAKRVGVSEATIKRGLNELRIKKAIRVKHRYTTKDGKKVQLPSEYALIDLQATDRTI